MTKTKVYIDGSEGTTGLRINERFEGREDIEILKIDSELRKDPEERKKFRDAMTGVYEKYCGEYMDIVRRIMTY